MSTVRTLVYNIDVYLIHFRSKTKLSPQKLTDSEITSITWAVYRQRRKSEESNPVKITDPKNHGNCQTDIPKTLGGNAHNRISRRSSYRYSGDCTYSGDPSYGSQAYQTAGNLGNQELPGFKRRYDSRCDRNSARFRNKDAENVYIIGKSNGYCDYAPDRTFNDSNTSLVRLPRAPLQYGHLSTDKPNSQAQNKDNRLATVPELDQSLVKKAGATRVNHDNNSVQFYNGTSAYFTSVGISEPVYL